jgi:hypothetical protein
MLQGKAKAKSKGNDEESPTQPVAMPEPSALMQSLIYLGGVVLAGWFFRRKRKVGAAQET